MTLTTTTSSFRSRHATTFALLVMFPGTLFAGIGGAFSPGVGEIAAGATFLWGGYLLWKSVRWRGRTFIVVATALLVAVAINSIVQGRQTRAESECRSGNADSFYCHGRHGQDACKAAFGHHPTFVTFRMMFRVL